MGHRQAMLEGFGPAVRAAAAASPAVALERRLRDGRARLAVFGLGYTGLPLALAFAGRGVHTRGLDIDATRVARIRSGAVPDCEESDALSAALASGLFDATTDIAALGDPDVIVLSVPTPLAANGDPDLRAVEAAARTAAGLLRPGMLVVLESTTFPGTTRQVVKPLLERGGLRSGVDFFLAYSPERLCPGGGVPVGEVPRLVAGEGLEAAALAELFYRQAFRDVVPVGSLEIAEAAKLLENVYRLVNVSLINELKGYFDRIGVPVHDVVAAAATKPYGFMPFYPGVGAGGHCIPVDSKYFLWTARQHDVATPILEHACLTNDAMPGVIADRTAAVLQDLSGVPLADATLVLVGVTYKKNVPDLRESAAVKLLQCLCARGARVLFNDARISDASARRLARSTGSEAVELTDPRIDTADAVVVCVAHDGVDLESLFGRCRLILDPQGLPRDARPATARYRQL